MSETAFQLQRLLRVRANDAGDAAEVRERSASEDEGGHEGGQNGRERFLVEFSSATRRLGKKPLALEEDERASLRAAGITWSLDAWGLDELGRAIALVRLAPLVSSGRWTADALKELVRECYTRGDNRERTAVLRALPLLLRSFSESHLEPGLELGAERFVPLAVEACRTHVDTIFRAICCDNPFPADHFPESNFCQMVIKALFTGASVPRIVGLEGRISSELIRMAEGFESERRAAGRALPGDLAYLLNMARERNTHEPTR